MTAPTTATPIEHNGEVIPVCEWCHEGVKRVPGGSGPVWVHDDGYRPCKAGRMHQYWIDVAQATHARQDASVVTLAFDTIEQATAFYESLCTGHELRGGGIRHDAGKPCLVHGVTEDTPF